MYKSIQSLAKHFKALFPDWEQCVQCNNFYPKKEFKLCVRCNKNLCSRCWREHHVNPYGACSESFGIE